MPGVDNRCTTHYACDCIQERIKELEQEVERLRVALEKYGRHTTECNPELTLIPYRDSQDRQRYNYKCTCGLEQALKGESK